MTNDHPHFEKHPNGCQWRHSSHTLTDSVRLCGARIGTDLCEPQRSFNCHYWPMVNHQQNHQIIKSPSKPLINGDYHQNLHQSLNRHEQWLMINGDYHQNNHQIIKITIQISERLRWGIPVPLRHQELEQVHRVVLDAATGLQELQKKGGEG